MSERTRPASCVDPARPSVRGGPVTRLVPACRVSGPGGLRRRPIGHAPSPSGAEAFVAADGRGLGSPRDTLRRVSGGLGSVPSGWSCTASQRPEPGLPAPPAPPARAAGGPPPPRHKPAPEGWGAHRATRPTDDATSGRGGLRLRPAARRRPRPRRLTGAAERGLVGAAGGADRARGSRRFAENSGGFGGPLRPGVRPPSPRGRPHV